MPFFREGGETNYLSNDRMYPDALSLFYKKIPSPRNHPEVFPLSEIFFIEILAQTKTFLFSDSILHEILPPTWESDLVEVV